MAEWTYKLDIDMLERKGTSACLAATRAMIARIRELEAELERAIQLGGGDSVPDGYALVPIVPTAAMIEAWNNSGADDFKISDPNYSEFTDQEWSVWKETNATKDWQAMVRASLDGRRES